MINEKMRLGEYEAFFEGNVGLGTSVMFPWGDSLQVIRIGDLASIVTTKLPGGGGSVSIGYNYYTDQEGVDRFMSPDGANKIVINNSGTYSYQSPAGVPNAQIDWTGNGSFALV